MKKPKLPEGWRTTSLGELLTEEQLAHVVRLLQKYAGQPTSSCMPELKAYLITQRASLEAKGVLPEFLTYVLADAFNRGQFDDHAPDSTSVTK